VVHERPRRDYQLRTDPSFLPSGQKARPVQSGRFDRISVCIAKFRSRLCLARAHTALADSLGRSRERDSILKQGVERMALVACRECQSEVADSAPTCPRCGVPNPAGKSAKLHIVRKKQIAAAAGAVDVELDGSHVASVRAGQSLSINVAPGEHRVQLTADLPKGPQRRALDTFSVTAQGAVTYEIGFSAWSGAMDLKRT